MKLSSTYLAAALAAWAGTAWAGPAAEEFRGLMVHDLKLQLPHEAVANLGSQLELAREKNPKEDWAPIEAEVGHLEKFYHDYTLLSRPGPARPQDLMDLSREFNQVSRDLNYRDAEMERKVNALFESHLDKMDAAAKTEAAKKSIQSLRSELTAGSGESPFQKQSRAQDPGLDSDYRIRGGPDRKDYTRAQLGAGVDLSKPGAWDTKENSFDEKRKDLDKNLDKTVVPAPGAGKKPQTAAPPKPAAKAGLARDTEINAGEAVAGLLCALSQEACGQVVLHQLLDRAR